MIKGLVRKIADRYIHKNLQAERVVTAMNFLKAKNVAFLVNVTEKQHYLEYRKLINELESRNKSAAHMALGWYKGKKVPEFVKASDKLQLMNRTDYNLIFRPKKKSVPIQRFLGGEYDLLIDLTKNEVYPLRKVLSLARSSFKVGAFEAGNEPFYDFMIKYRSTKDYTAQLVHYLSLLNKNG
ncbi:MAG: hypothetical protein V4616_02490 [Bacteroidota bacterium]